MDLRLSRSAPSFALLFAVLAAAPAGATELAAQTLTAPQTTTKNCHAGIASGAGIVRRDVRMASLSGTVAAVLKADAGDWDVAVFDKATGRAVAGAAGFGASEVASGFVGGGRTLVVQACRRSGATRAALRVRSEVVPTAGPDQRPSLVKVFVEDPAMKAWVAERFDATEHAGHDYVEVVAYGTRDLERLAQAGLRTSVEVPDLVAADRDRAAADRRSARVSLRAAGDTVPSGRTAYRRLMEYEADLKKLVDENPGLVKPIVLKNKTIEGRAVNGIEITRNVNVVNDGKPVFVQVGAHHAREWPSSEHAMEWAFELVNGVKAGDKELTELVGKVRTIVVPVINVDGFNVSREAPVDLVNNPEYQQVSDGGFGLGETAQYLVDPALNYKRRNCRLVDGVDTAPAGACATPPFRVSGVDPNRNYGGLWGGPGASALPVWDTYRGPAPFSEPETLNLRALVSERAVTTLITNHTFSNLILRPPGVRALGNPVDEPAMKDLSDRMSAKNGYLSQPSYMLYDTTGTTEDWTYLAAGGYGYTFEIGPDSAPAEGGGFHPPFSFTVGQFNRGSNDGGGNKAAYRLAMENTADPRHHSRITGRAPAGVQLRVQKDFVTQTSPVEPAQTDLVDAAPSPAGPRRQFSDSLSTTLDVAKTGAFAMAVNPSTRPVSDQNTIPGVSDKPTREESFTPKSQTSPNQIDGVGAEGTFEDFAFDVTEADAAKALRTTLAHDFPTDDYDIVLFRDEGGTLKEVGSSGSAPGSDEEILLDDPAIGKYVLRVNNYLAFNPYTVTVSRLGQGPDTIRPRQATEAWTLTCTVDGTLLGSQKVEVDRGKVADVKAPCGANAVAVVAAATGKSSAADRARCATSAGFESVGVEALGTRRARLVFARLAPNAVTVEVFQASSGSRVLANRRVGRFTKLSKSQTFAPKRLADGLYFARFSIKGLKQRTDTRRVTFSVRRGRMTVVRSHHRADSCGLLAGAKLENPAFGGRTRAPLRVAVRVARRSDVTVQIRKGVRVVRTFALRGVAGAKTRRLSVTASRLTAKGAYTVRITAVSAKRRATTTLASRRI